MSGNGLLNRVEKLNEVEPVRQVDLPAEAESSVGAGEGDILPPEDDCPHCRNFAAVQADSFVPQLILDTDLKIRWRNNSYRIFRETPGLHYYRERSFDDFFATFTGDSRESKIQRTQLFTSLADSGRGFAWQGAVEGKGPNQKAFMATLTIKPLVVNDDGSVRYFDATLQDITLGYQRLLHSSYEGMLKASLFKDEDTGNHIKRVNAYSRLLALALLKEKQNGNVRWIDVDKTFVDDIGELAAFHDVGKIGTPDHILGKKGKLNDDEWEVMREHPWNGALILASHPRPMAAEIARSHHERWDGSGYPSSQLCSKGLFPMPLEGEMIPLSGRIVAIADVYDALRTRRPYKEPFSEEKTAGIVIEDSGSHFDPGIVEVFKQLRKDFDRICRELAD